MRATRGRRRGSAAAGAELSTYAESGSSATASAASTDSSSSSSSAAGGGGSNAAQTRSRGGRRRRGGAPRGRGRGRRGRSAGAAAGAAADDDQRNGSAEPGTDATSKDGSEGPTVPPLEFIRQLALNPASDSNSVQPQKRCWEEAFTLVESQLDAAPDAPLKSSRQRSSKTGSKASSPTSRASASAPTLHFCSPLLFNQQMRDRNMIAAASGGGSGFEALSTSERIVNSYVEMVSRRFHNAEKLGIANGGVEFSSERMRTVGPHYHPAVLGGLLNPIREHSVVDKWSPLEVAKFEGGICLFGKRFHKLQQLIKTKTCKEIVEFYYNWKSTPNYKAWKKSYVPVKMQ